MTPNSDDEPIDWILDRYVMNNLVKIMKETVPMIIFIVDVPRPEYMRLLENTTCVFMYKGTDSTDANYDHDVSHGTNHKMNVYDNTDHDSMRSKVKAGEKTLVKAYVSYSTSDSISNTVHKITQTNLSGPMSILIDTRKNMQ